VPILWKDEILAVWARIFADHVAGAIVNARALEEIQRLKSRLEQQNSYLQEEVIEAKAFGDLIDKAQPCARLSVKSTWSHQLKHRF
jgi:hypothetical protein